jgi:hypothetical protein
MGACRLVGEGGSEIEQADEEDRKREGKREEFVAATVVLAEILEGFKR